MYTVGQRPKEGTAQKALLQIPALAKNECVPLVDIASLLQELNTMMKSKFIINIIS